MDYCKEIMASVVQTLKLNLKKYTEEYENAISGNLVCNYNHGRNRFYHAKTEGDKYVRSCLSMTEDHKILRRLARKEYLRIKIDRTAKDIVLLETVLGKYKNLDPSELIQSMKRAYKMMDATWFFENDDVQTREALAKEIQSKIGKLDVDDFRPLSESKILLHKSWAEKPYERNPCPFNVEGIYTSDGMQARSKAEAMIYECLLKYKVPFKFDALLSKIGEDGVPFFFAPDFAFEDAEFEEFYWEFCGMMAVEEYAQKHYEKRANYEKAGIVPWKNVIYTYSRGNDIDMGQIESIIRNQIIPRL